MQGLVIALLAGLALFLPDSKNDANNSETTQEKSSDEHLRETGRRHHARHVRGKQNRPTEEHHQPVTGETNSVEAESVETVGKESTSQEENDDARRQTTTNSGDGPVQQRESGTETAQPGDAVSTSETASDSSTDTNGGE